MKALKKCVVLDIKGRQVYLLAEGGSFYKLPWRGSLPAVGDEVLVAPPARAGSLQRLVRGALVACLAIFLVIGSAAIGYHNAPRAVAYVSVDINPSVELLISNKNRVMEVKPLNRDGKLILEKLPMRGLSGEDAVRGLTEQAARDGYLRPARYNVVLITVTPLEQEAASGLEQRLVQEAIRVLRVEHLPGKVDGLEATPAIREKARKLGLSPGRYAVLVGSLNADLKISPQTLREKSIAQVLEDAGGSVEGILNSLNGKDVQQQEDRLKAKLQQNQQPGSSIRNDLGGLLNQILGPAPPRSEPEMPPAATLGSGTGGTAAPLPNGGETTAPPAGGGEHLPILEKTLQPVKDNVLKPLDDNVLTPLDNLLGSLLGTREKQGEQPPPQ